MADGCGLRLALSPALGPELRPGRAHCTRAHATWSAASVHRLALMRDWPDGTLKLGVSKGCRAASAGGRDADGIQHLDEIFQGLLGPACIVPMSGLTQPRQLRRRRREICRIFVRLADHSFIFASISFFDSHCHTSVPTLPNPRGGGIERKAGGAPRADDRLLAFLKNS